jgi:hypothetical protein
VTGVEFLPEDGSDGADEELLVAPPHRTRPWWILGVLALVVGATVWVLTRPAEHPKPQPQALPAPLATTQPVGPSTPSDRDAGACRAPFCVASVVVPSELRRAIRHYLPQVTTIEVRSYLSRPNGSSYLADRDIDALAGSVSVLISLHRSVEPTSPPSAIVTAPAGVGSVLLHSMTPGFTIDLQYLAPETVPPALDRLQLLTKDPRLESL